MKTLDYLQLDPKKTEKTIDGLQKLLANLQLYYTNLRGYHWNVKGVTFFEAHEKYEEYYDDTADKVDEVAERILMLGGTPAHNFSDYLKVADIKETGVVSDAKEIAKQLLDQLKVLLAQEREILEVASDADDEGTIDLMTGFITDQEKIVWMLTAFAS
ncbi:MAG: DNA starvation/stationary phase protection protein [Bacteroidales bacterium]|nr:DNA starvation/stationary phase protection protein [Bacteroidales bacterium]